MAKTCARCIMTDKGDDTIKFDKNCICNYCTRALARMPSNYFPNEAGNKKLQKMLTEIKEHGKDKKYDCMMGISGGLDSSYLLYLGHKWGLRILAIHIDDGFDTELAKQNIKNLSEKCEVELITIKPNEAAFNDLTLSFLKASVPNIAIPQDSVLFSWLYKYAEDNGIKYFLSGYNFALENILQWGNTHYHDDLVHIKDIHKKFGTVEINELPLMSYAQKVKMRKKLKIQTLAPLNFIDYNKKRAIDELEKFCGFKYYEAKHYESIFTRFLQCYYLPTKFGVDKRTSHLSSLIVAGQMTRTEALKEMEKPPVNDETLQADILLITTRLGITREEFDAIMALPPRQHNFYKTDSKRRFLFYQLPGKVKTFFKLIVRG